MNRNQHAWLNPQDAASYLGMPSVRALYQSVRRGQVPAYRLGRRLRFRRSELDEVLARGRVSVPWPEGVSLPL